MHTIRGHISFANVMSVIAVFIALGGSAFAITKLKANSVGSKQLKAQAVKSADLADNAVSSTKVANGSLLSEDFEEGSLPTGPEGDPGPAGSPDTGAQILSKLAAVDGNGSGLDADRLDGLTSSDITDNFALKVADSLHLVGASGEPAFLNGYTSGPPVHGEAGFWRDGFGVVHLQGTVKVPAVFSNQVFVLPSGYRPVAAPVFVASRFGNGSVPKTPVGIVVDLFGNVSFLDDPGGGTFELDDEVHLDGVTFRCAPSGSNGCP